ncbi:DALR anticodon-binding domain-containing protein 3-like [Sinocyclocheilus grahami]|uniref:DALR anticodon-binding domain-containing protein 3-like n=1 Tax=Sinocyclocheilus grahami TaxID=75366 RepID=UPI0007AD0F83|nr:PREDICTED: DALR anticodon-binding domain-containing protein 3-like [Sinocyclocheilus grahami]
MEEAVPFNIVSTVKALSGALRRDAEHEAEISREREKHWFKESSAKNLRNRDFLSPSTVLTTLYAGGEVSLKYVLTCAFFIFCVMISSWPAPVTDAFSRFSAWQFYAWLEAPFPLCIVRKSVISLFSVQREALCHLAQLDSATTDFPISMTTALHVTSCQDEFRQQQTAVLWRATGATAVQRLVICGPVKTPGIQMNAAQYLQLRKAQMKEASEMKYGDQVEGQTWDDIIKVMTSATVRFELLSTVHTSPVTLDVQRDSGVSTKGPRGGVFVMYNCARLHTLFSSYEKGVEQGLYPEIPRGTELDFSALKEEGEWLLLFNYLIPFSELLDQSGQILEHEGSTARVNLRTEQVCRFLVSLSKDFSSYYNRVHVLGEPLPHLFNQMFCRLLLLRALRELYHSALDSLNLPPIPQL